jgi:hypothetical protein
LKKTPKTNKINLPTSKEEFQQKMARSRNYHIDLDEETVDILEEHGFSKTKMRNLTNNRESRNKKTKKFEDWDDNELQYKHNLNKKQKNQRKNKKYN